MSQLKIYVSTMGAIPVTSKIETPRGSGNLCAHHSFTAELRCGSRQFHTLTVNPATPQPRNKQTCLSNKSSLLPTLEKPAMTTHQPLFSWSTTTAMKSTSKTAQPYLWQTWWSPLIFSSTRTTVGRDSWCSRPNAKFRNTLVLPTKTKLRL